MRRRTLWTIPAALLLIAIGALFFTDLFGIDLAPFLPKIRLQQTQTWSSSTVTLEAVRDLYTFNTVEYVHRSVFPYDYLPEEISLTDVLAKLRSAESTVRAALTAEEYLYFQTYNLAGDIGMDLGGRRDFLVVTVVVTAGFDLASSALSSAPTAEGDRTTGTRGFRIEVTPGPEGETRRAIVRPPASSITDIRVEDIVSDEYPYPDISLGADAWRRVAEFVKEQVVQLPEVSELLVTATVNGQKFVRDILLRAGYDEVIFEGP